MFFFLQNYTLYFKGVSSIELAILDTILLIMFQKTKAHSQSLPVNPPIQNLLNSLDEVISNVQNFETNKILIKYELDVNNLLEDLDGLKQDLFQLTDSQQRCLNALNNSVDIDRSIDIMSFEEIINKCLEEIAAGIDFGNDTKLEQFAHSLYENLAPEYRKNISDTLEELKNEAVGKATTFEDIQDITESFDNLIIRLRR